MSLSAACPLLWHISYWKGSNQHCWTISTTLSLPKLFTVYNTNNVHRKVSKPCSLSKEVSQGVQPSNLSHPFHWWSHTLVVVSPGSQPHAHSWLHPAHLRLPCWVHQCSVGGWMGRISYLVERYRVVCWAQMRWAALPAPNKGEGLIGNEIQMTWTCSLWPYSKHIQLCTTTYLCV